MWLVFLLLIFLLIGIIFSSVEANLYSINVSERNSNFKISVSWKLFGFFTVLLIHLDKFGMKFFNKKILYKKFMKKLEIKKVNKEVLSFFKGLDIKYKKIYFTLKVGLIDVSLTNIAVVVLSSIVPIFLKNRVKQKNMNYEILPEYHKLDLNFKGKIIISIKSLTLIKLYLKNIKSEMAHTKSKNYNVKESFKYE